MNMQRYLMAAVAVFVVFGIVYIGATFLFADQFMAIMQGLNLNETETAASWVGRVLYSLVFVYIFVQGYEGKGIAEGVRYGLLIGLLLLGIDLDWYGVSNLAMGDALVWWIVDIVAAIAGGATAAAVYKPADAAPAEAAPSEPPAAGPPGGGDV